MRMKQIAKRGQFYVSPLLSPYRNGFKLERRATISPWKSKNGATQNRNKNKEIKKKVEANVRDVCSINPFHDVGSASSNYLMNLKDVKRFRPNQVCYMIIPLAVENF